MYLRRYYVNTTTCDDSENYVYVAYTAGECISFNETHFVPDCSSGESNLSNPFPYWGKKSPCRTRSVGVN